MIRRSLTICTVGYLCVEPRWHVDLWQEPTLPRQHLLEPAIIPGILPLPENKGYQTGEWHLVTWYQSVTWHTRCGYVDYCAVSTESYCLVLQHVNTKIWSRSLLASSSRSIYTLPDKCVSDYLLQAEVEWWCRLTPHDYFCCYKVVFPLCAQMYDVQSPYAVYVLAMFVFWDVANIGYILEHKWGNQPFSYHAHVVWSSCHVLSRPRLVTSASCHVRVLSCHDHVL